MTEAYYWDEAKHKGYRLKRIDPSQRKMSPVVVLTPEPGRNSEVKFSKDYFDTLVRRNEMQEISRYKLFQKINSNLS